MHERWTLDRRSLLIAAGGWLLAACTGRRGAAPHRSPASPARRPATRGLIYTVSKGDTLSAISRRSGLSVQAIVAANHLTTSNIQVGQKLRLPGITDLDPDPLARMVTARRETTAAPVGPGRYTLVKRSSWTHQGLRSNHRAMGSVHRITVHHTSEHGRMAQMNDLDVVKLIERYHRNERRWAAIGYHFLIGKDGRVYEGRPVNVQGAHTRGNNRNNIGVSLIGDCNSHMPEARQLAALESLLEDLRRRHDVPKRLVFGHRDLSPSVCPGKHLYKWLQGYKRR